MKLTRVALVGSGLMSRVHIQRMLEQGDTTEIVAICEPSQPAYEASVALFEAAELEPPPNQPDLSDLLVKYTGRIDAAFIVTPHALHYHQAKMCLEAGLDVLLEKPMVMNVAEAEGLVEARDRTGKLLVVAFQGGLSPQIRTAVEMLRSGELGSILTISAVAWQNWGDLTNGTWRQRPEISGGGFLFDTGAHMLNTVAELAGEDIVEVAAWLNNRGRSVEILGTVMGRLESGALVSLAGCGDTIRSCASEVRVFCTNAILRTGIWGERLQIQRNGRKRFSTVKVSESLGSWQQFVAVRNGEIANPCPPEVGLRMAHLWDAIQASATQDGVPVKVRATG